MTLPFDDVIKVSTWLTKKFRLIKKAPSAKKRLVYRGQVYWCEFGENVGSEQSDRRPALILSNNPANKTSPNVIVAPITNTSSTNPSVFPLNRSATSPLQGNVLLANIKTLSKARLGDLIDTLPKSEMPGIEKALFNAIGVAGKIDTLEKQLQRTSKHLEKTKEERNEAQDTLKQIAISLNLDESASGDDIIKKIERLSSEKG
ncbi:MULTISPECIES: type II toxin-antitoxin system PemK/MazF family toxin [Bacillus]|uniref:type II toxin-antitoxin system PemK/MazF family toxin n=1 Tax=Bacillus TaxID=1386 RepID=UPI000744CBF2